MKELSKQEQSFLAYWQKQRTKPHNKTFFLIKGLRYGLMFVGLTMLSMLTGWYKRVSFLSVGMMVSFLVACFLLVVFMAVFSAYYHLEQNEQKYHELCSRLSANQPNKSSS